VGTWIGYKHLTTIIYKRYSRHEQKTVTDLSKTDMIMTLLLPD